MNLSTPVANITRVGKVTASKLKRLDIFTIQDLLFYFPWRYDDFSMSTPIAQLQPNTRANVVGTVEMLNNKKSFKRRLNITEALISDDSEMLKVVWFNQPFIARNLQVGDRVSLSGKVDSDHGLTVMTSPIYEKITQQVIHTQGLVPNYHLTSDLSQKQLRFLINQVIDLAQQVEDWLPETIRQEQRLLTLATAIQKIHFPKNQQDIDQAKARLSFDELFLLQLQSQITRQAIIRNKALPIKFLEPKTKELVKSLPFVLTDDQRKTAWEILQDLETDQPMTRLLEGDVGSGKTVVALLALYNTVLNGYQAAIMVPTEVLAKQHFNSLNKLLSGFNINLALLTNSQQQTTNQEKITKAELGQQIANGQAQLIIGTHALIQQAVEFKNLNLVVIDEQHRFGVEQRQTLVAKASSTDQLMPHLLSMTATPIPRSLALALYDDLNISIIKQLPKDRQKIVTKIIGPEERQSSYDFIAQQVEQGRQVFVICPLIDISDNLGARSVKEEYDKLSQQIFPNLKIAMLHGKLKPKDKTAIMEKFSNNEINILVATSVIEVGIDIPNATVMMIEDANRFGLAQLHQYRGRVGRSQHQSYCFLMNDDSTSFGQQRLAAMLEYDNGFDLAQADLKFRGPGEVYGTLQKGFPELKIATLYDYALMKQAKEAAISLLQINPNLDNLPKIKEKIVNLAGLSHLE